METARPVLARLGIDFDRVVIVIRKGEICHTRSGLFLTAAERLGVEIEIRKH